MKKNREFSEEHNESKNERWLLTYSDIITLLLALFIILYSMSNVQAKKFAEMAEGFSDAFNTSEVSTGNGTGSGTGNGMSGLSISSMDPLSEIYLSLSEYVDKNNLSNEVSIVDSDSFVTIRLKSKLMFIPDSPQIIESSRPVVKEISKALVVVYDKIDRITISGNTANIGEYTEQTDDFSWYLSVNRANTVRRMLAEYGLPEDKISIEGYGHYNPIASNETEEGRALNRRAEITVYKNPSDN
jgi:chemotaxis protein MotB